MKTIYSINGKIAVINNITNSALYCSKNKCQKSLLKENPWKLFQASQQIFTLSWGKKGIKKKSQKREKRDLEFVANT